MSGRSEMQAIIDRQIAQLQRIRDDIPSLTCYDLIDQGESAFGVKRILDAMLEANMEAVIGTIDMLRSFGNHGYISRDECAQLRANQRDDVDGLIYDALEVAKMMSLGEVA